MAVLQTAHEHILTCADDATMAMSARIWRTNGLAFTELTSCYIAVARCNVWSE